MFGASKPVAVERISKSLVVPSTRRTSLGDRAFPAAAARAWNDLPPTITASPSLLSFNPLFTDIIMTGFSELN